MNYIKNILLVLIILSSLFQVSKAVDPVKQLPEILKDHAKEYGKIIVRDFKGRIKPMNTLDLEVLRKLSGKSKIYDQNADQVILGIIMFPDQWSQVPLIKIGRHKNIRNLIKKRGKLGAYNDFFDKNGNYIFKDLVRKAFQTETRDRGKFEKELLKLDERINIFNMLVNQRLLYIYPIPYNSSQKWMSPYEIKQDANSNNNDELYTYYSKLFPAYNTSIGEAIKTNNWDLPNQIVNEFRENQISNATNIPSNSKFKFELLLNKLNIFQRVRNIYGLLGFLVLILFFIKVFKPSIFLDKAFKVVYVLVFLTFLFQMAGLGMRWYISGRAPWSNGYESLVYISFTTMLAGVIFGRKSWGGLAAALILSSVILMVAGLSLFDPEITPLVPVLKSYWLTIHVSLEAGSYGFLLLGAILGFINLLLMIFMKESNKSRVMKTIKELTIISEMTLLAGLVMVSIGTHLGGIWANESWGRYWGWDPKETWALVTVLVYAFILHLRFIPGMRGIFTYNFSTLFGFASVMMTYFGVNYYLSGLHSYAAGDSIPIPPSVYYTALVFVAISFLAYIKARKLKIN